MRTAPARSRRAAFSRCRSPGGAGRLEVAASPLAARSRPVASRGRSRSARRGHARLRALGAGAAFADEKPRAHRTLPLHLDRPARLAVELVADELVGRVAQVDSPRHAVRLHPARRVHGIAPDIEHELPQADDPAHAGPAVHTDPESYPAFAPRPHLSGVAPITR